MIVFDASALLIFLQKKPGCLLVANHLERCRARGVHGLLSTVNWGEVYYSSLRAFGVLGAEKAANAIDELPIRIVSVDRTLVKLAAEYKASRNLSYPDCIAAALAKSHRLPLLTSDSGFKQVQAEIKIVWVR